MKFKGPGGDGDLLNRRQGRLQSLVRSTQFLRQDASFAGNAHEIRIADPAGHNVEMEVFANTRAGGVSEIHSEVETFRTIELFERPDHALRELHHFRQLFRRGYRRLRQLFG